MNLKEQICLSLCAGFVVRPVPMGFAIKSPFSWFTGDALTFYGRVKGGLIRFEDDGLTISELEGAGVDLSTDARLEIMGTLLREHSITYDETDVLFHSDWVPEADAGSQVAQFLSFLTRVQDLLFTTRERVVGTFRDDLLAAITERLGGEATISTDEAPVPRLSDYVVDIIVKHKSGKTAAIFPALSEQRALEAILFSKEIELKKVSNIIPFLIYEDASVKCVSKRTKSRAMNSDLEMAAWDGGQVDVVEKVAKYLRRNAFG
ncbi:DUF1828 domain-containing protein [Azospirillum cavernae]|uniref:DUF1828 domain-containing protein n=1 Tax=Azospirillum cavernae TaxID=2320860 RepID=A0A418W1T3_9PROT|nr:DUF1828 domain-containing protein [Azospirillum cavernae]RJF83973.1 DUF1828 domain-containing protein [Azospirillum cavernae]